MPFFDTDDKNISEKLQTLSYDFYQVPGYCNIEAEVLNGKSVYWYSNHNGYEIIIPLVERLIHKHFAPEKDLVSPYGYSGILYDEHISKENYIDVLKRFQFEAKQTGYTSTFIRLHPIYNSFVVNGIPNITQHRHSQTVSINLSIPVSSIRKGYSQNHKRDIRSLQKKGFSTYINKWTLLKDFIEVYSETMRRKNASRRYFFSEDYFVSLKNILGDSLVIVTVYIDHKIAAGGLFTIMNGLAQFHLGGTSEFALKHSPSKLMIDAAIQVCKNKGAHTLHLGGGLGSSNADGLYRFKSGFGTSTQYFNTLRFIHDPEKYNLLIKNNGLKVNNQVDFFPEYRFLSGS